MSQGFYPDEDYTLWCELHPCPDCDGAGIKEDGEDGSQEECIYCGGVGIDPEAEYNYKAERTDN